MEIINWLQEWYLKNCDGYWEHSFGIKIDTIDNPGWTVNIDLNETSLENNPFDEVDVKRSNNDWFHCRVRNNVFQGSGGSRNLIDIIVIFKDWVIIENNKEMP